MTDYTTEDVQELLEKYGEVIVVLDSDGYDEPPELHIHDTRFEHSSGMIHLSLSDGGTQFPASAIESVTYHEQSTADLGL